jgi:hypothetical protein
MGGAEAPIAAAESVAKMSRLIDRVSAAESGQFVDLEGNTIPW